MKFTLNDKTAQLWFSYKSETDTVTTSKGPIIRLKRMITCHFIPDISLKSKPEFTETVTCFHKDRYNKAQGRRVALEKVLYRFNRATRTAVWNAYWQKTRSRKETEEQQLLYRVYKLIEDPHREETNALLTHYKSPIRFHWQLGSDIYEYLLKKKLVK